jgi:hypothetical protein
MSRGARIYVHPAWDFRLLDVAVLASDHNLVVSNAGTVRGRALLELHPYHPQEHQMDKLTKPILRLNGRVRIRDTGWEGTVDAGSPHTNGTEHFRVTYTTLDGRTRRTWFDADQLQPLT